MKRFTMLTICLLAVASFMAMPAWAQNAHYITLSGGINTSNACYDVKLKEAGLGNSGVSSVSYLLTADASFTAGCYTKSGNLVNGSPKSGSGSAQSTTTIQVRNGSTSGTVSICPAAFTLPDPGCTGSQDLRITAASYSNISLDDQLGSISAGVQTFTDTGTVTFSSGIDVD